MIRPLLSGPLALFVAIGLGGDLVAQSAAANETVESAIYLLRESSNIEKDAARAARMLGALRQLRDPKLQPLFLSLLESEHGGLQVHGMLGLAECSPDRSLDLGHLTSLEFAAVQQRVVSLAMDLDLLTTEQAEQLMNWPGLDPTVRVLVATFLLQHGIEPDTEFLREATQSDKLGRANLAALLLLQNGDESAGKQLEQLNESDSPHRDTVRVHLLRTAFKSQFDRAGPWALQICDHEKADRVLGRLALLVALRFNAPGADQAWRQQYNQAADTIMRMRLALVSLNASAWVSPSLFEPIVTSSDLTLRTIGHIGRAAAAKSDVASEIRQGIDVNQTRVTEWALDYTKELASPTEARQILETIILAFDGPAARMEQRLRHAMRAAAALADRDVAVARTILRPLLSSPETDVHLVRGILAGLTKCRKNDPYPIIEDLEAFRNNPQANRLVLLIAARHGYELDEQQMHDLALVVRGGGNFQHHIRVQAAWSYLKRTGQADSAIAKAIE